MYFGEHYFADALAGWAVVGLSFLMWNRIERGWSQRTVAADNTPLDASNVPVDSSRVVARCLTPHSEQPGVRSPIDV